MRKSEKEIQERIEWMKRNESPTYQFQSGYVEALRWVLGEYDVDEG